jgi:hypothetical protein
MLHIVGKTDRGHLVIGGVYQFMETYGMPLDAIFDSLNNNGMIPSIYHLQNDAARAGANVERFNERIRLAWLDSYGTKL